MWWCHVYVQSISFYNLRNVRISSCFALRLFSYFGEMSGKSSNFRAIANRLFTRSISDMNISWNNLNNERSKQISSHSMTWVAHETEEAWCAAHIRHDFQNKACSHFPWSRAFGGLEGLKHSAVKRISTGLSATLAAKELLIRMSLIMWQSPKKLSNY